MSIDIRITQKGLLKKTLPLHVITGSDLCYGTSDGMKLKENDLSTDSAYPEIEVIRELKNEESVSVEIKDAIDEFDWE